MASVHPVPGCDQTSSVGETRRPFLVSAHETLLDKALRHVREGIERAERQEVLVAVLEINTTYRPQAALAREMLASLHASLEPRNRRLLAIEG
jgi:hypothetical protein